MRRQARSRAQQLPPVAVGRIGRSFAREPCVGFRGQQLIANGLELGPTYEVWTGKHEVFTSVQ